MKICVLIPVYDEAKHLPKILRGLRLLKIDVIVVDDGSVDDTAAIAESHGVVVLRHAKNLGKGAAIKTGFDYVKKNDWDAVLIMDGDGQHSVDDVKNFVEGYDRADILVGNRMGWTRNMPLERLVTNIVMSKVISLLAGQKIEDSQCGFKLIKRNVIFDLELGTSNFETDSELLLDAAAKHYKISSVPVKTIYESESSKIRPLRDTILFFKLILTGINVKFRRKKHS